MRSGRVFWLVVWLAGCNSPRPAQSSDDAMPQKPTPADAHLSDAPLNPIDAMRAQVLRFIAVGDTGRGDDGIRAVAAAMKDVCDHRGCDFILLLGDNIYYAGVDSVTDPQWQTKFEEPYAAIDLPFYAALGNHDYG